MLGMGLYACNSSTSTTPATKSPRSVYTNGSPVSASTTEGSQKSEQQSGGIKPTHRIVAGKGYSLRLPIDGWKVIDKPDPTIFHAGAVVGMTSDDGCQGAIVLTKRRTEEKLETAKERIVKSLELTELQTVFENRMLYNSKTGYQYNVRGERKQADGDFNVLRYQGTLMRDRNWFVEVRAWSQRSFEPARSCHDTVTASFTNLGLGKLQDQKKNE